MALFCSSVGTLYLLLPELPLTSGWAVAPLRCCQPNKLGASLVKAYSPECVEGEFSEVGLPIYGVLRSSASAPSLFLGIGAGPACRAALREASRHVLWPARPSASGP